MDDLAGLDWNASDSQPINKTPATGTGNYYPSLRPTPPISGRSTPAINPGPASISKGLTNSNVPSKSSTPANDSFANLLPFNSPSPKNLSLQEQQKLLQEQRAKQELDRRKQGSGHLGPSDANAWDILGNGRATPERKVSPPTYAATDEYGGQKLSSAINKPFAALGGASSSTKQKTTGNDDDLFAAFNADTPVDRSTNFPVSSDIPTPNRKQSGLQPVEGVSINEADEDDPFGLGTLPQTTQSRQPLSPTEDDDDVLGLLGRPVSEMPVRRARSPSPPPPPSTTNSPLDKAIAELVDMGFSPEKSKEALEATESGLNVQAAVGWLLNQAHEQSRSKSNVATARGRNLDESQEDQPRRKEDRLADVDSTSALPTWMKQQSRSNSTARREDSRSPANGERDAAKDAAKIAAELRTNLFKTANSLWKTGTKKLNQAVAEFNAEGEPNQPKWMREAQAERKGSNAQPRKDAKANLDQVPVSNKKMPPSARSPDMTDEAMMLESGDSRPRPRQKPQPSEPKPAYREELTRDQSPVISSSRRDVQNDQPRFIHQPVAAQPKSKLNRHLVDEENAAAYVSPARRKRTPKPPSPEPDLLFDASQASTSAPLSRPKAAPTPTPQVRPKVSPPLPTRPPPPKRTIPHLSSIALQSSTSHRLAGTAAFKLGNYAQATASYTSSLSSLPAGHPLTILLLTNRALTHLKTGDPKASIADADSALEIIGPSRGQSETIDIGGDEGSKDMAQFWGKAMTRRAEALEQLERWADAAKAWKDCVEGGVGGGLSIQGRNRCEKAAGGGTTAPPVRKATPAKKPASRPAPKASALDDLSGRPSLPTASSAEAVTRLRAANLEAERVDDEKFALADIVDERLSKWRKGKEGNLRALLGSLDTVLWEGAGWKKVGMSELIIPGKVKVVYMKGIAKVHPDKLPTTATTEQVMISGAVFSTLNEAWDRFKSENGL